MPCSADDSFVRRLGEDDYTVGVMRSDLITKYIGSSGRIGPDGEDSHE